MYTNLHSHRYMNMSIYSTACPISLPSPVDVKAMKK